MTRPRRRVFGRAGSELIHGRIFHRSFSGSSGPSLKYYVGGPVRFWRQGRLVPLDRFGFVLINAGEDYAFEAPQPETTQMTTVFFAAGETEAAWSSVSRSTEAELEAPDDRPPSAGFSNWLHRADVLMPAFAARLRAERDVTPERVDELLALLLARVMETEARLRRVRAGFAPVRSAQREELLRRISLARRFIDANAHREVTLDEMAAAASLSKHYFLRRFRTVIGVTPMAYRSGVRLDRAATLVAAGQPLTEVALDCGYADLASFSNSFRRRFGAAPSAWRKGDRRQARAGHS